LMFMFMFMFMFPVEVECCKWIPDAKMDSRCLVIAASIWNLSRWGVSASWHGMMAVYFWSLSRCSRHDRYKAA